MKHLGVRGPSADAEKRTDPDQLQPPVSTACFGRPRSTRDTSGGGPRWIEIAETTGTKSDPYVQLFACSQPCPVHVHHVYRSLTHSLTLSLITNHYRRTETSESIGGPHSALDQRLVREGVGGILVGVVVARPISVVSSVSSVCSVSSFRRGVRRRRCVNSAAARNSVKIASVLP